MRRGEPFVKWPGGKRLQVHLLSRLLPGRMGAYWEPFVGGGAVFFGVSGRLGTAHLSDANRELVTTYEVVRTDVERLIGRLREFQAEHRRMAGRTHADGSTCYQRIRAWEPEPNDEAGVAARMIYLNRTGYNGLYRVNRNGGFNVADGRYDNPRICDAEGLRRASRALRDVRLRAGDFERTANPGEGDVVYCDPPYHGGFDSYTAPGFGFDDQVRLRDAAERWVRAGAVVVLSNADTPVIRNLYAGWRMDAVLSPRAINRKASARGAVGELLISRGLR